MIRVSESQHRHLALARSCGKLSLSDRSLSAMQRNCSHTRSVVFGNER